MKFLKSLLLISGSFIFFLSGAITNQAQAKVSAYWTGIAGVYVTDGKNSLYFDPVFTRPGVWDIVFDTDIVLETELIDKSLKRLGIESLDAIFITHSHFDHAIDSAYIAKKTSATIHGSLTTKNLALSQNYQKTIVNKNDEAHTYGDFEVKVLPAEHGKILGLFEFAPGELDKAKKKLSMSDFKMGGAFSYLVSYKGKPLMLMQQASRYTPELKKRLRGLQIDYIFQGLGNRKSTADLAKNIWSLTSAKKIIPVHHDMFFFKVNEKETVDHLWGVKFDEFLSVAKELNYIPYNPQYFSEITLIP